MNIKIEKKHLYIFLVLVLVVGLIGFGYAYNTGQPASIVGHDFGELEGIQKSISSGLTACSAADRSIKTIDPVTGAVTCEIDDGGIDTNAATLCVGTDVYLDGEGNCDTVISSSCGADQVRVGSTCRVIPDCDLETETLNYDQSTDTFSCNNDDGGGVATDLVCVGCVSSTDILDDGIGNVDIGNNQIANRHLAASSVQGVQIDTDAVTGSKIASNAVTSSKIASGAVGSSEVADNSLTSSDLGANSVGSSEIASNAVGSSEIAARAVGDSELLDAGAYQGRTSLSYDGRDISTYNQGDIKCAGNFPLSHMCTAVDFMLFGPPTAEGWYSTYVYSSATDDLRISDCKGWRSSSSSERGPFWTTTDESRPSNRRCSQDHKILCCRG